MKKFFAAAASLLLPLSVQAQELGGKLLDDTAKRANYRSGTTVEQIVGTVINAALLLLGVIFLILIVYGGYIWLIARGDEAKVEKAKDTIVRAVIGLIIVLAAYAITFFVINALVEKTLTGQ